MKHGCVGWKNREKEEMEKIWKMEKNSGKLGKIEKNSEKIEKMRNGGN